jgi:hypothetical protein
MNLTLPADYDPQEQIIDPHSHPNLKLSVYGTAAYLLAYFGAFIMHIIVRWFAKVYRNLPVLK